MSSSSFSDRLELSASFSALTTFAFALIFALAGWLAIYGDPGMDGWDGRMDGRMDITQFLSMIDTSYLPRNLLQVHGKHLYRFDDLV